MSFKSIFVQEDITPKSKPSISVPKTIQQTYTPTVVSNVDSEIKETLLQSLQDNKMSGFDYLKFITTVEKMKALGGNEDVKFKSAFIAAEQLGLDKTKLVESANHYLDVLKQDNKEFKANFASKQNETIDLNISKLNEINNTLNNLTAQITKLTEDKQNLTTKINDNKVKLENKKSAFDVTYNSLVKEIEGNIQKINQYL